MHVALTDVLTCPSCGPGHGLILVPDEVRERRVVAGFLGCADCRERYRVVGGIADLGGGGSVGASDAVGSREGALRLAGALGLAAGRGVVLLVGPAASHAGELAAVTEGQEIVATLEEALAGVSSVRVGVALPFQSGTLRGVALTGGAADSLLEEGARVLAPQSRLFLEPASGRARERVEAAGLTVLVEDAGTLVAKR